MSKITLQLFLKVNILYSVIVPWGGGIATLKEMRLDGRGFSWSQTL